MCIRGGRGGSGRRWALHSLKAILTLLAKHHQRATYGAVAELLGRTPRSLLSGSPRDFLHCWVVNRETGQPTAYLVGMIHPSLEERPEILESAEELHAWLRARGYAGRGSAKP